MKSLSNPNDITAPIQNECKDSSGQQKKVMPILDTERFLSASGPRQDEVMSFQSPVVKIFEDNTINGMKHLSEEELVHKVQELERSNRDLESFAYTASHDLREPLRTVSSLVELLAQRSQTLQDPDIKKIITLVTENCTRMNHMILDLLDYSRIQTKGSAFSPEELNLTLEVALTNLIEVIKETGAKITQDALPTIKGDGTQLVQVFQNLISNAIKYRKEKEKAIIHVGVSPSNGNEWHFYVRDNGIGIDPKYFDKLFVMFQRLHAQNKYAGTGVGLATCKKIIERHGGRIWVESVLGMGSTFHFTLPLLKV